MSIHRNYLTLTPVEKRLVDVLINQAFALTKLPLYRGTQLSGDDRAERAAEALATWVVESRS